MAWPIIPDDAVNWVRTIFAEANRATTERLMNVPNIRETSLDDGFVEAITPNSSPRQLASGAIVHLQVHNIGGLRRVQKWETADIAILVFVTHLGKIIGQKIGLLQSKRLYPSNGDVDDSDAISFMYGLNAMLSRDDARPIGGLFRNYEFNEDCVYGAITAGDHQTETIDDFNAQFGEAIYYLFYNPNRLPASVSYPLRKRTNITKPRLGCRVYRASEVHAACNDFNDGQHPTIGVVQSKGGKRSNWRVETWVADMLLRCKVGQQFDESKSDMIDRLVTRRSGPIGAAISVSIALDAARRPD
jgi:hypothetical protein